MSTNGLVIRRSYGSASPRRREVVSTVERPRPRPLIIQQGGNEENRNSGLRRLKSRSWGSVRRWEKENEFLFAMIEDEADWLGCLFPDEIIAPEFFFFSLEDGVLLCKLALLIQEYADKYGEANEVKIPKYVFKFHPRSRTRGQLGQFRARENVTEFLTWCRKHCIPEVILFESNDVVQTDGDELREGAREVVICLMEIARKACKYGVKPPKLIIMEREIELEEKREQCGSPTSVDSGVETENYTDCTKKIENGKRIISGRGSEPHDDVFDDNKDGSQPPMNIPVAVDEDVDSASVSPKHGNKQDHTDLPPKPQTELDAKVLNLVNEYSVGKITRLKEGKYIILGRVMFIRMLNEHVLVRIGGGWDGLEHYLMTHVREGAQTQKTPAPESDLSRSGTPTLLIETRLQSRKLSRRENITAPNPSLADTNSTGEYRAFTPPLPPSLATRGRDNTGRKTSRVKATDEADIVRAIRKIETAVSGNISRKTVSVSSTPNSEECRNFLRSRKPSRTKMADLIIGSQDIASETHPDIDNVEITAEPESNHFSETEIAQSGDDNNNIESTGVDCDDVVESKQMKDTPHVVNGDVASMDADGVVDEPCNEEFKVHVSKNVSEKSAKESSSNTKNPGKIQKGNAPKTAATSSSKKPASKASSASQAKTAKSTTAAKSTTRKVTASATKPTAASGTKPTSAKPTAAKAGSKPKPNGAAATSKTGKDLPDGANSKAKVATAKSSSSENKKDGKDSSKMTRTAPLKTVTSSVKSSVSSAKSAGSSGKTTASSAKTAVSSAKPAASATKPAPSSSKLGASSSKPAASSAKTAASSVKSVASSAKPSPGAKKVEPTSTDKAAAKSTGKPASKPSSAPPKSTASKPSANSTKPSSAGPSKAATAAKQTTTSKSANAAKPSAGSKPASSNKAGSAAKTTSSKPESTTKATSTAKSAPGAKPASSAKPAAATKQAAATKPGSAHPSKTKPSTALTSKKPSSAPLKSTASSSKSDSAKASSAATKKAVSSGSKSAPAKAKSPPPGSTSAKAKQAASAKLSTSAKQTSGAKAATQTSKATSAKEAKAAKSAKPSDSKASAKANKAAPKKADSKTGSDAKKATIKQEELNSEVAAKEVLFVTLPCKEMISSIEPSSVEGEVTIVSSRLQEETFKTVETPELSGQSNTETIETITVKLSTETHEVYMKELESPPEHQGTATNVLESNIDNYKSQDEELESHDQEPKSNDEELKSHDEELKSHDEVLISHVKEQESRVADILDQEHEVHHIELESNNHEPRDDPTQPRFEEVESHDKELESHVEEHELRVADLHDKEHEVHHVELESNAHEPRDDPAQPRVEEVESHDKELESHVEEHELRAADLHDKEHEVHHVELESNDHEPRDDLTRPRVEEVESHVEEHESRVVDLHDHDQVHEVHHVELESSDHEPRDDLTRSHVEEVEPHNTELKSHVIDHEKVCENLESRIMDQYSRDVELESGHEELESHFRDNKAADEGLLSPLASDKTSDEAPQSSFEELESRIIDSESRVINNESRGDFFESHVAETVSDRNEQEYEAGDEEFVSRVVDNGARDEVLASSFEELESRVVESEARDGEHDSRVNYESREELLESNVPRTDSDEVQQHVPSVTTFGELESHVEETEPRDEDYEPREELLESHVLGTESDEVQPEILSGADLPSGATEPRESSPEHVVYEDEQQGAEIKSNEFQLGIEEMVTESSEVMDHYEPTNQMEESLSAPELEGESTLEMQQVVLDDERKVEYEQDGSSGSGDREQIDTTEDRHDTDSHQMLDGELDQQLNANTQHETEIANKLDDTEEDQIATDDHYEKSSEGVFDQHMEDIVSGSGVENIESDSRGAVKADSHTSEDEQVATGDLDRVVGSMADEETHDEPTAECETDDQNAVDQASAGFAERAEYADDAPQNEPGASEDSSVDKFDERKLEALEEITAKCSEDEIREGAIAPSPPETPVPDNIPETTPTEPDSDVENRERMDSSASIDDQSNVRDESNEGGVDKSEEFTQKEGYSEGEAHSESPKELEGDSQEDSPIASSAEDYAQQHYTVVSDNDAHSMSDARDFQPGDSTENASAKGDAAFRGEPRDSDFDGNQETTPSVEDSVRDDIPVGSDEVKTDYAVSQGLEEANGDTHAASQLNDDASDVHAHDETPHHYQGDMTELRDGLNAESRAEVGDHQEESSFTESLIQTVDDVEVQQEPGFDEEMFNNRLDEEHQMSEMMFSEEEKPRDDVKATDEEYQHRETGDPESDSDETKTEVSENVTDSVAAASHEDSQTEVLTKHGETTSIFSDNNADEEPSNTSDVFDFQAEHVVNDGLESFESLDSKIDEPIEQPSEQIDRDSIDYSANLHEDPESNVNDNIEDVTEGYGMNAAVDREDLGLNADANQNLEANLDPGSSTPDNELDLPEAEDAEDDRFGHSTSPCNLSINLTSHRNDGCGQDDVYTPVSDLPDGVTSPLAGVSFDQADPNEDEAKYREEGLNRDVFQHSEENPADSACDDVASSGHDFLKDNQTPAREADETREVNQSEDVLSSESSQQSLLAAENLKQPNVVSSPLMSSDSEDSSDDDDEDEATKDSGVVDFEAERRSMEIQDSSVRLQQGLDGNDEAIRESEPRLDEEDLLDDIVRGDVQDTGSFNGISSEGSLTVENSIGSHDDVLQNDSETNSSEEVTGSRHTDIELENGAVSNEFATDANDFVLLDSPNKESQPLHNELSENESGSENSPFHHIDIQNQNCVAEMHGEDSQAITENESAMAPCDAEMPGDVTDDAQSMPDHVGESHTQTSGWCSENHIGDESFTTKYKSEEVSHSTVTTECHSISTTEYTCQELSQSVSTTEVSHSGDGGTAHEMPDFNADMQSLPNQDENRNANISSDHSAKLNQDKADSSYPRYVYDASDDDDDDDDETY